LEVAGKIPFDPIVTELWSLGKPLLNISPDSRVSQEIKSCVKENPYAFE